MLALHDTVEMPIPKGFWILDSVEQSEHLVEYTSKLSFKKTLNIYIFVPNIPKEELVVVLFEFNFI